VGRQQPIALYKVNVSRLEWTWGLANFLASSLMVLNTNHKPVGLI